MTFRVIVDNFKIASASFSTAGICLYKLDSNSGGQLNNIMSGWSQAGLHGRGRPGRTVPISSELPSNVNS